MSAPIATPAELAQSLATALRVGPLAAGGASMGPLSTRGGYRGGPLASSRDPRFTEHVCIGFVAGAAPCGTSPAELLAVVGPIHKALRALVDGGAPLEPLQVAVLASLRAQAHADVALFCARLNAAASDRRAETWPLSAVERALHALAGLGLAHLEGRDWRAA